jgi:hypothetical protein
MRAAADGLDSLARQASGSAELPVDEQHRLVHTLDEPILDQLPEPGDLGAPVQLLELYAPFHDPHATALRALVERYRPAHVRLAVQSDGRTVWDPAAVSGVVEGLRSELKFDFTIIEDRGDRYRHGKLVQATLENGRRWALTGSPNLSTVALLRTSRRGGNVEVGVVTTDPPSLFPAGTEIDMLHATHGAIAAGPGDTQAGGNFTAVLLLAAVLREGVLHVTLAKPAHTEVMLLASRNIDYDEWMPVGRIPVGVRVAKLPLTAGLGSADRVRPQWEGPDRGRRTGVRCLLGH